MIYNQGMPLPKALTTVTPLSKSVALFLFIALPISAFLFGMKYQLLLEESNTPIPFFPPAKACTLEAKLCADGSSVGRVGPNCEFAPCPTPSSLKPVQFCGGIAGKVCPGGFTCKYDGTYPDAGGICITGEMKPLYVCPTTGWVNCMPILTEEAKKGCSKEAVEWYKVNCPNFKGTAY